MLGTVLLASAGLTTDSADVSFLLILADCKNGLGLFVALGFRLAGLLVVVVVVVLKVVRIVLGDKVCMGVVFRSANTFSGDSLSGVKLGNLLMLSEDNVFGVSDTFIGS